MRFPFRATFRIIPVSPLSDMDAADDSPIKPFFDRQFIHPCFATATSGTFDPDLQFNGDDIASGAFGSFVDIWLSSGEHKKFMQVITDNGITFSATLMLRLVDLKDVSANRRLKSTTLFDPTFDVDMQRGFPLASTRVYPTMTAFTFRLNRIGL